jgi:hypothetical protein
MTGRDMTDTGEVAEAAVEVEIAAPVAPSPAPAAKTSLPDLSATDPKVVIEPATPATQAAAEQDVTTLEPPRGEKDDDDQPKRRGWWNRFV